MGSSVLDNFSGGSAGEFLKEQILPGSSLSIASAYFNFFAYDKLKDCLDDIDHLRFLFGEPKFIRKVGNAMENNRSFRITDDELSIPASQRLEQKAAAKACADWIRNKVEIRSLVEPDFLHGKMYHIRQPNGMETALVGSVGLGKTYEVLAIIKYFESLNQRALVICPKKLSDNWTIYQAHKNITLNPFPKDRFAFNVIYHTDLNRMTGDMEADKLDISLFGWSTYDLVVIDESHNFRNNIKGKLKDDGERIQSRYERLMNDIIKSGGKTRVVMLSATPVNNSLRDLRNQIYFITEGSDTALSETAGIKNIETTIKNAQTQFTLWSDPKKNPNRTVRDLLLRLDSSFIKMLDELTIARSRKHILKNYSMDGIGKFPEREKVMSVYPVIDLQNRFPSYDKLNREIMKYNLSLFNPTAYLKEGYKEYYEELAGVRIRNFSQEKREHFLIGMMKVNFLKRLESSIHSFGISMDRTIRKIEELEQKIGSFIQSGYEIDEGIEPVDVSDPEDEELEEANENLYVGKKIRFHLKDMDLEKWLKDLQSDKDQLIDLYNNAQSITPERDAKLHLLKQIIREKSEKPLNNTNRKILVFTAFADTASYLYQALEPWVTGELNMNIALVSGGTMENRTSFRPTGKNLRKQNDFSAILTNFSPCSKKRHLMKDMPQEGEIDLLIATDCISEGQNLQDCDVVVNYDIHWNPVRIIQRFGRIDRIGSKNEKIRMVNFWPTKDLDNYINLKERVEARMALVDLTATQEEDILNNEQLEELIAEDLKFRNRQLKKLQDVVLDLEELDENLNLSDFTLDDFRIELMNFLKNNEQLLKEAPMGLYAMFISVTTGRCASNMSTPNRSWKYTGPCVPGATNLLGSFATCLTRRPTRAATWSVTTTC